jgi:two-component system cell cycle response regulator
MAPQLETRIFPEPLSGPVSATGPAAQAGPPLRMVVADDSAVSRALMQRLLGKLGFNPQMAADGVSAWDLLQQEDVPTIAILDWMMPGMEGIEVCRKMRRLSHQHYTYAMLLTGKTEKNDIIEGLQAGADDYMTKPFDAEELQARLMVAQRIISFQEELFAAREVLRNQASHDYLTQLLNRGGIMETLEQELSRSRRTGAAFSVIIADIDHFKQINDTFGHLTGDDVLFEVANRIKTCMRSYDSVGRYGGEEFLLVVPGCDQSQAFQVAEKIRKAVSQTPLHMSQAEKTVTISLGVCTRTGETTPEQMITAADSALYRAKGSGRNRTELSSAVGNEIATISS